MQTFQSKYICLKGTLLNERGDGEPKTLVK